MEIATFDASEDRAAVETVIRQSMQTSYALSPEEINMLAEVEFGEEAMDEKAERSDLVLLVAREDDEVVGYGEGELGEDSAKVRWLHVEPGHRGQDVGTDLFERLRDEFHDRGVEDVRASVLTQNQEGSAFFERFGFERVGSEDLEFDGQELSAEVYARPESGATDEMDLVVEEGESPPESAETDEGRAVYLSGEDPIPGTVTRFFRAYTEPDHEELYGYFCGSCGTVTTSVDAQDRIVCPECGNEHQPDEWDSSYL